MTVYNDLKCWEIMNCDQLDCLSRSDAKIPCWQIAKRVGSFQHVSNTCRECIVYLLQNETSVINKKEIFKILTHRDNFEIMRTEYHVCILKTLSIH